MFQLISKEAILTNVLLDYIKLQQAAHRTALALLDGMVPELESKLGKIITRYYYMLIFTHYITIYCAPVFFYYRKQSNKTSFWITIGRTS